MEPSASGFQAEKNNGFKGTTLISPIGATPRPPIKGNHLSPASQLTKTKANGLHQEFTQIRHRGTSGDDSSHDMSTHETSLHDTSRSTRAFLFLGLVFIGAVLLLLIVYLNFPKVEPNEKQYFTLPSSIEDAKNLGRVLSKHKNTYYYEVLGAYFATYIFLQTFAIPGSIFLSILSGFLFPFPLALFLVCLSSSLGATFCYLLADLVGKPLVWKYIPDRASSWADKVDRHREHLLNYIIFLRITPFLPNWFINITSPVIHVPVSPFFWGTFIGVAPPSFVAIRGGTMLYQLTSTGDTVSMTSVLVLFALAILSILPVIFKKKLEKKME